MNDLKKIELLGSGGFGKVFRAQNKKTGDLLAVKYFGDQNFLDIKLEDYLLSKVESINNENRFIKYYGLFQMEENSQVEYILLMESGEINLSEVLKMRRLYKLENTLYIFSSLVRDLLYLQENGIATRDVKTENVILIPHDDNLFHYKIADFGIGCFLKGECEEINKEELFGLTEAYAAPEVKLIGEDKYEKKTYDPFKADVYSLGILIIELLGGNDVETFKKEFKTNILYDIIMKMVMEDPFERISFLGVKKILDDLSSKGYISKQPNNEKEFIKMHLDWKKRGKNNDEKLKDYLDQFWSYYEICNYKIASQILDFCYNDIYLENQDDPNIKNKKIEGDLFNYLGLFNYSVKQDYMKAKEFYYKSLNIRNSIFKFPHKDIAQSYNNLAELYFEVEKNYKKAEEYYLKSLNIKESILGLDKETALSYNNLAVFYKYTKDYNKSQEFYNKSLNVIKTFRDENQDIKASLYDNIALFYQEINKDYVKAEEIYIESLNIRESFLGNNHIDTASSYHNLAMLYHIFKKEYKKAEDLFINSLAIFEKYYGISHSSTQHVLKNMYYFFKDSKKDPEKAAEIFKKIKTK